MSHQVLNIKIFISSILISFLHFSISFVCICDVHVKIVSSISSNASTYSLEARYHLQVFASLHIKSIHIATVIIMFIDSVKKHQSLVNVLQFLFPIVLMFGAMILLKVTYSLALTGSINLKYVFFIISLLLFFHGFLFCSCNLNAVMFKKIIC